MSTKPPKIYPFALPHLDMKAFGAQVDAINTRGQMKRDVAVLLQTTVNAIMNVDRPPEVQAVLAGIFEGAAQELRKRIRADRKKNGH